MDAKNVVDGGIGHRAHSVREALENMDITRPDAPKGFVKRIAEENGWTIDRAQRADREYRRFLVLAATTSEMVVPSRDVDAVWHEHLLHTRHYWDVTCGTIIGRPFHHDPGDGSGGDATMHAAGYERTLDLYERTFGEPAPADVWPRACRCAAVRPAEAETVLALPAWTMLVGLSPIAFLALPGVVGAMVGAALLALALIAVIAQTQADKERERAARRPATPARPRIQGQPTIAKSSARGSSTSGSRRSRTEETSRSSDDPMMATVWMNDGVGTASTHQSSHAAVHCDTGSTHSTTSSHSSHCDSGSSHSSHSSCGGSSHSSCGGSSSSCGGSSCGGSSCGGGGCGGS